MRPLAVLRLDGASVRELAGHSALWRHDSLEDGDARLTVGVVPDDAEPLTVLGAFQRSSELPSAAPGNLVRRGTGGGPALVGPGTVWLQLTLSRPDALVPCTVDTLINRYVRPLLRALTKSTGFVASYFGRDWISAGHRPVAIVAFAHEADTGRCAFEAIVATREPFASSSRASFLGKEPATLEAVRAGPVDPHAVADAIVDAYARAAGDVRPLARAGAPATAPSLSVEPSWAATQEEAIGTIAAGIDGSGRLRVGGELMASVDAIERLEAKLSALSAAERETDVDAVGAAVDEAFTTGGAVIFGVRSLASLRDVIVRAIRTSPGEHSST